MQGVILAIAKARQTFDRDGSEAGLIKVSLFFLNLLSSYHKHSNNGAVIPLDGKKWDEVCSSLTPKTPLPVLHPTAPPSGANIPLELCPAASHQAWRAVVVLSSSPLRELPL